MPEGLWLALYEEPYRLLILAASASRVSKLLYAPVYCRWRPPQF